jgi:hypothetical protein
MTTEVKVFRKLRARAPGTGLSRDFCTDDAIYGHREWLFAAHTADWYCSCLAARFETKEFTDVA